MSLSDLASLGSFVSGVAVLISLIFLYFQLRQLGQQVRQAERNQQASIRHSRVTRNVDILLARVDPGLINAWQHGIRDPDKLTETEAAQFLGMCRANFWALEDAFYQHEEGLLNEDAWSTVLATNRTLIGIPGYRVAWKAGVRRGYAGRFRDFVDDLAARASLEPATPAITVDVLKAVYAAETAGERS
jgi:hypothetical protein